MDAFKDMTRVTLQEGDVLIVRVDRGNMTSFAFNEYANSIRDTLKTYFLSNDIIIMDKSITLSILNNGEHNGTPTNT